MRKQGVVRIVLIEWNALSSQLLQCPAVHHAAFESHHHVGRKSARSIEDCRIKLRAQHRVNQSYKDLRQDFLAVRIPSVGRHVNDLVARSPQRIPDARALLPYQSLPRNSIRYPKFINLLNPITLRARRTRQPPRDAARGTQGSLASAHRRNKRELRACSRCWRSLNASPDAPGKTRSFPVLRPVNQSPHLRTFLVQLQHIGCSLVQHQPPHAGISKVLVVVKSAPDEPAFFGKIARLIFAVAKAFTYPCPNSGLPSALARTRRDRHLSFQPGAPNLQRKIRSQREQLIEDFSLPAVCTAITATSAP